MKRTLRRSPFSYKFVAELPHVNTTLPDSFPIFCFGRILPLSTGGT